MKAIAGSTSLAVVQGAHGASIVRTEKSAASRRVAYLYVVLLLGVVGLVAGRWMWAGADALVAAMFSVVAVAIALCSLDVPAAFFGGTRKSAHRELCDRIDVTPVDEGDGYRKGASLRAVVDGKRYDIGDARLVVWRGRSAARGGPSSWHVVTLVVGGHAYDLDSFSESEHVTWTTEELRRILRLPPPIESKFELPGLGLFGWASMMLSLSAAAVASGISFFVRDDPSAWTNVAILFLAAQLVLLGPLYYLDRARRRWGEMTFRQAYQAARSLAESRRLAAPSDVTGLLDVVEAPVAPVVVREVVPGGFRVLPEAHTTTSSGREEATAPEDERSNDDATTGTVRGDGTP